MTFSINRLFRRLLMPMVVLITGASQGLGLKTAEVFAKKGHRVYGSTRNKEKQGERRTFASGGFIETLCLDVTDAASCAEAVRYVIDREGRIDILINNAGFGIAGPVELTSDEEMIAQYETNFFGAVRMCREVLPYMRKQRSGKIINISSVAASVPIPFQAFYSSGKLALESLSRALALEVKNFGIKVSALEFGDMKTGFTKNRRIVKAALEDENNDRIYTDIFIRSLRTMEKDEENGPEPDGAALFIYKTAMKKNSRLIKVHRFVYKLIVMLIRLLPLRLSNYIIGKLYAS